MQTSLVNEKKSVKEVLIGIGLIVAFMLAGLLWINTDETKEEYRPLTPQAQVSYDSAFKALCEAEKTLAASKILDVANGVKMDVDMNALIAKRDKECVF